MVVKDMYQSGINVLIDGFKALTDGSSTDDIPNYGAKSNTMFDHCKITFLVSDIRGVELITLKSLANKVEVLSTRPFTFPKKLRPTIFSNEYPTVNKTEEYQRFLDVSSKVVQKNLSLIKELPEEIREIPAMYKYNFAGSVAFDALVTFSGSNITQLIGVFPGQSLREQDGSWIDPNGQFFINKAIASFKKIYYDALEGIFGTVDMQTDVALEKMYFTKLRRRSLSDLDPTSVKIQNVLYAQVIHPMGSIDLISEGRPTTMEEQTAVKELTAQRMDYANSVVDEFCSRDVFNNRPEYLLQNSTFIIYAQCSIQTLLMLYAYTDIVTYYADMKNVMGVSDLPAPVMVKTAGGIKIDGNEYAIPDDIADAMAHTRNELVVELAKDIEAEKADVLNALRKYHRERDFYEENRYKNTKLRPPKSMIQRKEYYNMVPLYATTCCVLKFTEKDVMRMLDLVTSKTSIAQTNTEFIMIQRAMGAIYSMATNYFSVFNK